MSARHPIISVTGSSGAGTTTVKHTFEQIFRREDINAAYIEGDAFHRYDRAGMRAAMAEAAGSGNNHFSHFGPEANLLEELEAVFARLRPDRARAGRATTSTTSARRSATARRPAPSRPGRTSRPAPTSCSTRGCTAPSSPRRRRRAARRPQDRRRAGHQPRMDPEAPPRQGGPRLLDRGRDGHDPAADARLHPLHLPAVHADRHQLPAGADGRHLEPVHRPLHPDPRQVDGRDPLQEPARDRLPLPASR